MELGEVDGAELGRKAAVGPCVIAPLEGPIVASVGPTVTNEGCEVGNNEGMVLGITVGKILG